MNKEWNVINRNPGGNIIQLLLEGRNIKNPVHFLTPVESDMLPYEDLSNIKEAADIVLKAVEEGKRIHILFDPDNDGCSSGAILYRYLIPYTYMVTWEINVGKRHGLNAEIIPSYVGKYDLVIAVDSSSESYEEQAFLIKNNIQLVILDHHKIKNISKCSGVIVNSQLNGYKNEALAGAGVVFKFVMYLDSIQGTTGAEDYFDLATSGIIGDMQDVSENSMENRYICSMGFKNLKNPGLKEIIGDYQFNGTSVTYSINPIVNAGVRTKHGELSASILLEDDKKIIKGIIEELKDLKVIQNIQKDALVKVLAQEIIDKKMENQKVMGFIIPDREGILKADITGLVANVICDLYDCLVIIVHTSEVKGLYKGSIRGNGVKSFMDLILSTKLVKYCAGHDGAAGIGVYESKWDTLLTTLNKKLENTELKLTSQIDMILKPKDLTTTLIKKIEYINIISGTGFKPINFLIEGLEPGYRNVSTMKDIHSKFEADGMEFIKWNSDLSSKLGYAQGIYKTVDIIGVPSISHFRGRTKRQMILSDYKIEENLEFFR
ncbi:DHH family phosphoesterase [Clostridium estertheticum]|uniref:DHH family phosphoesterase n=1 Tax=Clostridium estertheticum TaxID=238834 RepID=UPI001C0C8AD9|nr:DHH family phosphoesterase [Clostridium estertheticum]MBU3186529.1 DHH family phosphoesterase [Clostridium estertheticum]